MTINDFTALIVCAIVVLFAYWIMLTTGTWSRFSLYRLSKRLRLNPGEVAPKLSVYGFIFRSMKLEHLWWQRTINKDGETSYEVTAQFKTSPYELKIYTPPPVERPKVD